MSDPKPPEEAAQRPAIASEDLRMKIGYPLDREYMTQERIEEYQRAGYRVTTDPKTGQMVLRDKIVIKGTGSKPSEFVGNQAPPESRDRR
jgi:hypothetical protein